MRAYAQKQSQPQQEMSLHRSRPTQRMIGNQAAQVLPHANDKGHKAESCASATTGFAHDFSRIPARSKEPVRLQAKLTVNSPGDIYEQEADRIAEQAMRMPDGADPVGASLRSRVAPATAQRAETAGEVTYAPSVMQHALSAGERPLDLAARTFMERRLGQNFGQVRVHTGTAAAESARMMNARAYTVGQHIVFGANEYAPNTDDGRRIIAHELAHVLQQRSVITQPRVQRWSYGSGTHTSGSETFEELSEAEKAGSYGVDASMSLIDPLVTGTGWRAKNCQQWFTKNCTIARSLAKIHDRAVIWINRAAPASIAGHTSGVDSANHAHAEWLVKKNARWSLAGNMIHEYWHDCSTSADPDVGDEASSACGLPVI